MKLKIGIKECRNECKNSFVNIFLFPLSLKLKTTIQTLVSSSLKRKPIISLYYNISCSFIIIEIINIQTYIWHHCFHRARVWLLHFVTIIERGNVQERTSSFIVYRSILHFFKLLIGVVHNQIWDLSAEEISIRYMYAEE